jgi:hypothetical protein
MKELSQFFLAQVLNVGGNSKLMKSDRKAIAAQHD